MIDDSPTFRFKRFALSDRRCGMKIGTDGVMLGAWAVLPDGKTDIADIGTGSGLIAMMMAQRYAGAHITAVEIDADAAADAADNIAASPFDNRIDVVNMPFDAFYSKVDLIVSNPPFFATGERAPAQSRAIARHIGSLSPEALVDRAPALLNRGGSLAMITPADNADDLIFRATVAKLYPRRICSVTSRKGKQPYRILWQFSTDDGPCIQDELTIRHADNSYTDNYINLTKDFYLNL
ncbi:MAG: methyltransferase [Bacteroidales bacterium]|nr:methyltransferase [Bacteroidales bacterium]